MLTQGDTIGLAQNLIPARLVVQLLALSQGQHKELTVKLGWDEPSHNHWNS